MPYVKDSDGADGGGGNATGLDDFLRNKVAAFITSTTLFAAGDHWTRSKADVNIGTDEYEIFLTPPANRTANVDAPPYMAFHTLGTNIFMFPASGFDTATPAYDQPGGPGCYPPAASGAPDWSDEKNVQCPTVGGSVPNAAFLQHHLFAPSNGRYCYAVVQIATRRWRHFMFGNFDKFGGQSAYDGGEFVWPGYWSHYDAFAIDNPYYVGSSGYSAHKAPGWRDSYTGSFGTTGDARRCALFRAVGQQAGAANGPYEWFAVKGCGTALDAAGQSRPSGAGYSNVNQASGAQYMGVGATNGGGGASLGNALFRLSASLLSNTKPLLPIYLGLNTTIDAGPRMAVIGQVPDVFRVNMHGFTPAQQITIGSYDYVVFPVTNSDQVNTVAGDEYSGYEGLAYRINP